MRKKLLLADDSITIQKVVELTFPSDEFEVVTAGNGRLAVDKALAFLPDVVLCDVIMPQLDGYQVCEALRASPELAKVPILLLNGAFEPYDAERAKSVGALGNVSKPFDPPALVARVKEILNERSTAAFARPDPESLAPVVLDDIAGPEPVVAAPHEYTYDESETHPVSTVEVPMDVREMAARSLSLDAPVFAPTEPEVLTTPEEVLATEPSDFAQTLHGPLDAEVGAEVTEEVASAVEMTAEAEHAEAIEPMDEIQPIAAIAATGEFDAPVAEGAAAALTEPMEFDEEPAEVEAIPTPAPIPASATVPVHEFSGEHEFDPSELDTPVIQTAEVEASPEPEPMALPEEIPAAVADPLPPPPPPEAPVYVAPPEPEPVIALPAFAPEPVVEAAPRPAAGNGAPSLPSAEVAVPVDMVQQIAQRVISQVSERVIREIAWDVIPGLAEKLIKAEIERIKARAESESD